ncbi:hypothetical protein [Nonomuraea sp. NPDC003804]
MRNLTITSASWTADDNDVLAGADKRESSDTVEAATVDYGYARI